MNRSHKACWRWKRRLNLLAAEALEAAAATETEAHLTSCPGCQRHFAELRALAATLERTGHQLPSDEPSPALRERWQAALQTPETNTKPSPAGPAKTPGSAWILDWLPGGRRAVPALAAAWILIVLLRVSSPNVTGPSAAPPQAPLRDILTVLQSAEFTLPVAPAPIDEPLAPPNASRSRVPAPFRPHERSQA